MKAIKNFEGLYSITREGEVFSHRINKFITKHPLKPNGVLTYYETALYKNGFCKRFKIHRLVAETFIPNPENKLVVDHINRVKTDNRVENLRWVSKTENQRNKGKTTRKVTSNPQSNYKGVSWDKAKSKWVTYCVDGNGKKKNLGRFTDEKEAATAYNNYVKETFNEFNFLNII